MDSLLTLCSMMWKQNTSGVQVEITGGRYKFDNAKGVVIWKLPEFVGGAEFQISGEITMVSTLSDKAWVKPPIKLKFSVSF